MPRYGRIVVIKRNGTDGIVFPLNSTSCLFGRKTECDIRMRLPWVSSEHCKIDINENKEAVLTNLSAVNPTQLNGACFEQPVPLKHGDVLTIIDRSFRFEHPLQSTPKKRRSRSPKDETLQVLHVQQVAEVEILHKQTSGAKSLEASENAECEEKNANKNKQTPEENLPKAFPVKVRTPKSSQRIHHVLKKQDEMSPFTKLYQSLKNELKVEKPLPRGSASQQAAKGDPGSVLPDPSAPIPSLGCPFDLGSPAGGKETGRVGNIEECIIVRREGISPGFNQLSAPGRRTPRKSLARSSRIPISKEVSGDTGQSPLQELRTPGRPKGAAVTPKPSKENCRDSLVLREQCSIEKLDCPAKGPACSSTTPVSRVAEGGKCVLNTPAPRRKSPRSLFVSPPEETTGMNPDTPRTPRRGSLKLKSLPEIPAGAPQEDPVCRMDNAQLPLPDDKCLKQRRNSRQQTPGKPVQEVLKEIWDQANLDNVKVGHCETPASLPSSKSPRGDSRESKEFLDKSAHSEALASEGMLASPAGQTPGRKRGKPRTSGVLAETALETNTAQEHLSSGRKATGTPAELATDRCHQNQGLEDASATRPRRPSAKRSPGNAAELRDTEPGSETKPFGLLHGEDSGKTKRISQKRKSGEALPQTLGKRKRVSFGGQLSPELFDKSLPPNSPLKRGALPARRSLPNGNSPRAVLKKAQVLKHLIDQEEKKSPKNSPAQQSPGASSPVSRTATPQIPAGSPAPFRKGRFSISRPPTPFPIAEEKDAGTEDMDPEGKSDVQRKTPESAPATRDAEASAAVTAAKTARGAQLGVKGSAMKSRCGAVAVISAKRRSGASSANLLVAKSWAEVVKLGVARPQSKPAKKSVRKGRALKRRNHPPKTPEKKIKDDFSTGHAESPATIVVGRAYSTTVRSAGHVPKVVKNPKLKLNMDMDESFTGMPEVFRTPENPGGETFPLAAAQDADFTPPWSAGDISDLHTPEESGEMMVSPLNNLDASEQKQESPGIFCFLREESSPSMFDETATKTPEKREAVHDDSVDSLAIIPEKPASLVKSGRKRRTPKQKLEPVEVKSGKRKILRTPEQKAEAGEVLSGIKRLMKTPRQKPEPAEALSGIKQLLKTPKQKLEPVEALSGIKQLMKTPKQKLEPVEALSGIKQLMKTPKQKLEPAEALSGIKQLMKTPKQKLEPAESLSGIKQLMKTPKQKLEPVESLSGIKQLMRTPRRKAEPVEHLSGIKQLLRTPQQELEPVTDEIALKRLLETPVESREAVKALPDVTSTRKTPKLKSQPVEDMVGISRIFQTPKEKVEPIDNMFGISRLMKSPKEKYQPVEDFVGLQRLMAEPRQKSDSEVDYAGVTEMFGTPEEVKVRSVNVMDSQEEIPPPGSNSSQKHEKKGNVSQGEDSQEKDSTGEEQHTQRPRRGRPKRAVPPAAAKPSGNGVNFKELQSPDTQEEMGAITPENKGRRGRRAKRYVQEVVPKRPDQEGLDTVSSVEPAGAAQRPGRGQRKELKELKHPNENLESCVEDSSVVPANTQQSLQDCGINETEDDPGTKTGAGNTQNENCQLQTGLNNPDSKANDSGIEDSEEVLLSPRRRRRGAENTEPVIPPKRGRRARNDRGKAASPGDLCATTRKLRKDPSPKATQRQEQACDKAPEAVTAQESENDTKLELKATDTRVKSFRSTRSRKRSDEIKAGTREVTLENTQSIQKTEETSAGTDAETQSHVKNEIKGTQGCETENAQEKTTEAARRLKAESPYAGTNKMPVSAQNVEANRARNRRGKIDSLEQKADEFTENVNGLKPIISKFKSETEVDESSLQSSVGSVCVSAAEARKEQPSPGATSVPAAGSASPAQGSQRRTRKEQGILKAKQTEILRGNPAQGNAGLCRRGRGRKVNFQLEEGSSKAAEGKTLPGGDEGMADKHNQRGNSENPSSQGRRGRRKQLDSTPQEAGHALMEKQTLSADHRKDEAVITEQGSALEAAPSSAEDNPPRRGRRREAAAASQTRSPSVRTRRGVLEGDAKKVAERKDEIPALGSKTSQAKVNASARDRRRKMDPAAEATGSAPLQGKCGLSEIKDEGTQEEQGVPLEAVSCAKEKPPGRGRRKETALASHATNSISFRGKRGLPAGDGEEAPKEAQNVPLETCDPSGKENLRRGRRKEIAPLIEAKSSIQGNQVLSKQGGRRNNNREAKPSLDNSSQENKDLVKGSSRQATISLALSPTSLQGLPEDGKDGIPEEQSKLLEVAPPTKENPSRVGRKKATSSTSEGTISTSLRGRPNLPRGRGQKRILKEHEDASPENNPCQGRTRQLRNNRRKVEFPLEAASSTSPHKSSDLPENGNTLETQDLSRASTGSEENQSGKGQEGDPAPQAAPTSRRRKCQLPAEDVAPKKLKSGNGENGSLQRGRRNKTKLGEEDARAAQTTGGMERRTRSSTRTRK